MAATDPGCEVRLYQLRAAVAAAQDCFGKEAARAVEESMSAAFSEALAPVETGMSWTPVQHMIDWSLAVWEGPAGRERPLMVDYTRRQVALGFGRLRRALIAVASPRLLLTRAPELWDKDNRGGKVSVQLGEHEGVWTLVDHPYCEVPHARAAMAEVLRYCVELTRARDVTESHGLYRGALEVRVRWR